MIVVIWYLNSINAVYIVIKFHWNHGLLVSYKLNALTSKCVTTIRANLRLKSYVMLVLCLAEKEY